MIVNVHKVLLYGAKEEMDRFFSLAQRAGFLEFIGIWHKKALELPQNARNLLSAIKHLRLYHRAKIDLNLSIPQTPSALAEMVVHKNAALERLLEEKRILSAEIVRIAPFGDFSKEELASIERDGKRIVQFFCRKSEADHDGVLPPELIYLGVEYDLGYYIAINREKVQYPKMIEIHILRPVGELREDLKDKESRIALLEAEMRDFSRHIEFLSEGLNDVMNEHHLKSASHDASSPLGDVLFAIEAWVPENRKKSLQGLLSSLSVSFEEISIEPLDRIPTCMENVALGKIGEDIVQVYDTPSITDKDPSKWVIVFFSVFFAMIISDAGYGLFYLAIAFFLKWKFPDLRGGGKRFIKMLFIIATTTILWGVFTASFFGIEIGPDNPYRKMSLLHYMAKSKAEYLMAQKNEVYREWVHAFPQVENAKDGHDFLVLASTKQGGETSYTALTDFYDNILLEFSLMMGVIHLSLSLLRTARRNWSNFGWILFMIGGYLYFPVTMLDATSLLLFMGLVTKSFALFYGVILLYGGVGWAFLAAVFQRGIVKGLQELLNSIQVFSDVLSYLRLYALGLAGMLVASTFNKMGLNFGYAGIFIILGGHIMNLGLSVMSGVIHGLRLNFIEWYRYSFEGGGRLFNPLRLKKTSY